MSYIKKKKRKTIETCLGQEDYRIRNIVEEER